MFVEVTENGRTYNINLAKVIYTMEVLETLEVMLEGRSQAFRFSDAGTKEAIKAAIKALSD